MTDPNPITPPDELVQQWYIECPESNEAALVYVATQAARWAADAELEACCQWLGETTAATWLGDRLRCFRRPVQPSLKEQALKALEHLSGWDGDADTIRRALEALPDDPAVTPPAAAPDRPLWEAMQAAHDKAATNRSGYAAELHAVANWLETKHDSDQIVHTVWEAAQWLRAEAERAEAP